MTLRILSLCLAPCIAFCCCSKRQEPPDAKNSEDEIRPLGQRLIEAIPLPGEGEFNTPEAAAKAYAEGLIANNWDRVLRASTIRLRCERVSFEAFTVDFAALNPLDSPDFSSPMIQFLTEFQSMRTLRETQLALGGIGWETRRWVPNEADETLTRELAASLKNQVLYRRPKNLRFVEATRNDQLGKKAWENSGTAEVYKDLGVTDASWVNATVAGVPNKGEVVLEFIVFKIDSNWLVEKAWVQATPGEDR